MRTVALLLLIACTLLACPPNRQQEPLAYKKKFHRLGGNNAWGVPEHPLLRRERNRQRRADRERMRLGERHVSAGGDRLTLSANEIEFAPFPPGQPPERILTVTSHDRPLRLRGATAEGDCLQVLPPLDNRPARELEIAVKPCPALPPGHFAARIVLQFKAGADHTVTVPVYGQVDSAWRIAPSPRPLRDLRPGAPFTRKMYLYAPQANAIREHHEEGSPLAIEITPISGHDAGQYLLTARGTAPAAGSFVHTSIRIVPEPARDAFDLVVFGEVPQSATPSRPGRRHQ